MSVSKPTSWRMSASALFVVLAMTLLAPAVTHAETTETFKPVRNGERALVFRLGGVEPSTITAAKAETLASHQRIHRWLSRRYAGRPAARRRAHRNVHRRLHRRLSAERVRSSAASGGPLRLGKPSWARGGNVRVTVTTPETTITSGPSGTVSSPDASFHFASSDAGASFECRLDGAAWNACSSPSSSNGLGEGAHVFEVRAINSSGADPSPAKGSFTVDLGGDGEPEAGIPAGNLTTNPSFEQDTSNWLGWQSSIGRVADASAPHGSSAARLTWNGTAGGYGIDDSGDTVTSAVAGTVYTGRAYIKATPATAGKPVILKVRERANGSPVGSRTVTVTPSATSYTAAEVTYTASGTGNTIDITATRLDGLVSGDAFYADAISLVSGGGTGAPGQRRLTVATTGSGTVTGPGISCPGDCSESYADGTNVTLDATAGSGATFSGWSGACTGADPCTTQMNADRSVAAVFTQATAPPPSGDACSFAGITSCTLLKEDLGTQADVKPLWGNTTYCASSSRIQHIDPGFRRLSVHDGDNVWGERCEIANNNNRNGEDGGNGTFQLYREGQHKLTTMRIRLPGSFPLDTPYWQSVGQMKQAQPADNGGGTPALALQVYEGKWQLHQSTSTGPSSVTRPIWTAPATKGSWTRIAWDVTYSQDPSKGKIQMFVDLNGDGDANDGGERSPVLNTYTLKRETATNSGDGVTDDGVAEGQSIPSHLRLGIYHDDRISCPPPGGCSAEYDDVQVFRVN